MDHGNAGHDGGIVQGVAGLEGVRPVQDHVVAVDQPRDVLLSKHLLVEDDVHVGIERVDRPTCGLCLLLTHPVGRVDDLALEVGQVDDVEVDHADRANARGRQVEGRRRTETARADQERLRVQQLLLPLGADLGDEEVP